MNALTAARAQMEVSLGFHMVFAALGIGMPLLMVVAEALFLRTGRPHYRELARKWGKATALLFAIGAVSGTALSFELGLLWPRFMAFAGGIIGPAFALEGYAFFVEAIFVGLYLYGWDRLSSRAHWLCGIPVAVSGVLSGALVVAANAWMQLPAGFRLVDGRAVEVQATAPFQSAVWPVMSLHSTLSCYIAVGFAVAGVYAVGMLRGRRDAYHRSALDIALAVAAVAALLQLPSGDASAKAIARHEPAKLAAAEALFRTTRGAPLLLGGLPDARDERVRFGVEVPRALSLLASGDPDATVRGLDAVPAGERPNVLVTHVAFQVMVGAGFALIALGGGYWLVRLRLRRRRRRPGEARPRWLLGALVAGSPLGFLALEAGWVVTEAGRQPWIIRGVMLTRDAVTPSGQVPLSFAGFTALYLALAAALVALLRHLARAGVGHGPADEAEGAPAEAASAAVEARG